MVSPTVSTDAVSTAPAAKAAAGRHIVVFEAETADAPGLATRLASAQGALPEHVYQRTIKGFSAVMSAQAANALVADPAVAYVEADQIITLAAKPDKPGKPGGGGGEDPPPPSQETPLGITRVGGTSDASGLTATAWVIDTGIDLNHADLNVDAGRSVSFTRGKKTADDGHGTHVAGIIGSGTTSGVIAGIEYVAANAVAGDVANMSLGGGFSQALNDAVTAAAGGGVAFALAAGN
jgi:hypothetical protein